MRTMMLGLMAASGLAITAPATPVLAQQAAGSFEATCRNVQVSGGSLTAECRDTRGGYHVSTIPYRMCRGDIGNNDGILNCNGARASGGELVGGGYAGGDRAYGPPPNDRDHGGVYPQFASREEHIRDAIRDGVRDGRIPHDDARDLFGQLGDIQAREHREFQVHGWQLPYDDRMRIQRQLERLDQRVDQYGGR